MKRKALVVIFCIFALVQASVAQSTITIYEPRGIVCAEDDLGNYIGRTDEDNSIKQLGFRKFRRTQRRLKFRLKRKLRKSNRKYQKASRHFDNGAITAEELAEYQTAKDTAQYDFNLITNALTLARQCRNDELDPNGDGNGSTGGGGDTGGDTGGGGGDLDPNVNACDVVGGTSQFSYDYIINGTNCPNRGNSPVVQLTMQYNSGGDGLCSGTVVHPNYVISAAHCLLDNPTGITVLTGLGDFAADFFIGHPDWDQNQNVQENQDVAVIRIPGSGIPTRTIDMYGGASFTAGETMVISGFGINSNNVDSVFRAGLMLLDSNTSAGITAKYNGTGSNTCSGDSGGPLLMSRDGAYKLVGVTSNGLLQKCGPGDTSNFANLSDPSVKSFITQHTGISY